MHGNTFGLCHVVNELDEFISDTLIVGIFGLRYVSVVVAAAASTSNDFNWRRGWGLFIATLRLATLRPDTSSISRTDDVFVLRGRIGPCFMLMGAAFVTRGVDWGAA